MQDEFLESKLVFALQILQFQGYLCIYYQSSIYLIIKWIRILSVKEWTQNAKRYRVT